jgi:hypothetical protein
MALRPRDIQAPDPDRGIYVDMEGIMEVIDIFESLRYFLLVFFLCWPSRKNCTGIIQILCCISVVVCLTRITGTGTVYGTGTYQQCCVSSPF